MGARRKPGSYKQMHELGLGEMEMAKNKKQEGTTRSKLTGVESTRELPSSHGREKK